LVSPNFVVHSRGSGAAGLLEIGAAEHVHLFDEIVSNSIKIASYFFDNLQHAAYLLRFFEKLPILRLMNSQKVIRVKYHVFPSPLQRHVKRTGIRNSAFHAD
jgi:hypothetical protein